MDRSLYPEKNIYGWTHFRRKILVCYPEKYDVRNWARVLEKGKKYIGEFSCTFPALALLTYINA